jgi:hypothetical protein
VSRLLYCFTAALLLLYCACLLLLYCCFTAAFQAYLALAALALLCVTVHRFEAQTGLDPVLCGLNWLTLLASLLQVLSLLALLVQKYEY